ncbi:MAG: hybrid sensor histidine kinase/response regulator [Anaerolineae bacterium]|nr:hybrid sensor histidine kinase/response regulator [Anaerolineae bacterium]
MSEYKRTETILIVDDNEMNRDLLVGVLDRDEYQAVTAMNGQTALDLVQAHDVDLILLDINMPHMDGYEVCQRLKADERTMDIPVIFISALGETDDIVKGFDVGGGDYITKPFKFREVLARVEGQLMLYRQKRQIEAMMKRERHQHKVLDELRKQFIGSATHDLKNPIFVISGYLDMMERQPTITENERMQGYVNAMRRGVDKMNHLVRDMLDLLQLEHGVVLDKVDYVFSAFVRESVQDMVMRAKEKGLDFSVDVPDDKATIAIDPKRMNRVLDNLVSNAIKYTPEDGSIRVIAYLDEDTAALEVVDTGLGIPNESLATLFDPFQRVETVEHMEQEGSGLGLSIVKAIVEQHEGTITVQSEVGQGSTFRVELPRGLISGISDV